MIGSYVVPGMVVLSHKLQEVTFCQSFSIWIRVLLNAKCLIRLSSISFYLVVTSRVQWKQSPCNSKAMPILCPHPSVSCLVGAASYEVAYGL